jgi:hypothetical protein
MLWCILLVVVVVVVVLLLLALVMESTRVVLRRVRWPRRGRQRAAAAGTGCAETTATVGPGRACHQLLRLRVRVRQRA